MSELLGVLAWIVIPLVSVALDILPAGRAGRRRVCDITASTPSISDFEVIVPIYGDVKYLENLDYLAEYGSPRVAVHDRRRRRTVQPQPGDDCP